MTYSRTGLPFGIDVRGRSLFGAPINAGVPVLDQDINVMQALQIDDRRRMFEQTFTAGWNNIFGPTDFQNRGINNFSIGTCGFLFSGFNITYLGSFTASNTITVTSTNAPADPVYSNISPFNPLPVAPTHTHDLVFLEMWFEVIDDTGILYPFGNVNYYNPSLFPSNDIVDPAVGDMATARMQLRYRTRVVAGNDEMVADLASDDNVYIQGKHAQNDRVRRFVLEAQQPYYKNDTTATTVVGDFDDFEGVVYAIPVCMIERVVGDDDLANATFTDLRVRVRVRNQGNGMNGANVSPTEYSVTVIFNRNSTALLTWNATTFATAGGTPTVELDDGVTSLQTSTINAAGYDRPSGSYFYGPSLMSEPTLKTFFLRVLNSGGSDAVFSAGDTTSITAVVFT